MSILINNLPLPQFHSLMFAGVFDILGSPRLWGVIILGIGVVASELNNGERVKNGTCNTSGATLARPVSVASWTVAFWVADSPDSLVMGGLEDL